VEDYVNNERNDRTHMLILRGLSYKEAREIADNAFGGSLMWHGGKAWPHSVGGPCEVLPLSSDPAKLADEVERMRPAWLLWQALVRTPSEIGFTHRATPEDMKEWANDVISRAATDEVNPPSANTASDPASPQPHPPPAHAP
jgi:hypothetical protein